MRDNYINKINQLRSVNASNATHKDPFHAVFATQNEYDAGDKSQQVVVQFTFVCGSVYFAVAESYCGVG